MKNELKKEIGFLAALSCVIGMVIGSGVFFKPNAVYSATGAPGMGMIAWVVGGILTLAGALTAAEISAAIPKTGGMVAYLEEAYGDIWGYILGWVQSVLYFPAIIGALAIIFATQVVSLLNLSNGTLIPIAIITTIFLIGMNILGAKVGGAIQTVSTIGKLIPLVAIIIVGLFYTGGGGTANLLPVSAANHPFVTSFGSALLAIMFAYEGWINVGAIAGEMKNPEKDLPRAIIIGTLIIIAIYCSINLAYLFVLPASALAASKTPAADVAKIIFGTSGGKVITVGILVSIFGALNGNILAGMRIPYVMAVQNKLPGSSWLAKLHPKYKTPMNSGIFICVITIILICTGTFNQLTDLFVFVVWIFYVLTFFAVFTLRKNRPDLKRPYKVPLYPITPIIAIVGGIYIVVNTLVTQPLNAGLGIVVILVGLPIYMARKDKIIKIDDEEAQDIL